MNRNYGTVILRPVMFGDAMLILGRSEQIVNTQEITENLEKATEQ